MRTSQANVLEVLDRLEAHHGAQQPAGPLDPYEMIVYLNCGYPASDTACTRGYQALEREVGTDPDKILAASKARLAKLMRLGGIVPAERALRLKTIARMVTQEFGGNLKLAVQKLLQGKEGTAEKRIRQAKTALKKFPVIGDPGADKILLFARLAPVAAVPSAFTAVAQRLWHGGENQNYVAGYRAAQQTLAAGLAETFEARERAYLLLKRHGQEICKRSKPKCEACPLSGMCRYFLTNRPE